MPLKHIILTLLIVLSTSTAQAASHGDLNCDDTLDVVDVVLAINLALQIPLSEEIDTNQDNVPDACEFVVSEVNCGKDTVLNEAGDNCVVAPGVLEDIAAESFQAGVASVDTKAYFDDGFAQGFQAGLASADPADFCGKGTAVKDGLCDAVPALVCPDPLEILCDNGDLDACCDLGDPSACCELGDLIACCETGDAIACCETGDPAVDCQVAGGDCESIPCNQGLTCLSGICVYAAGLGEDCSTENTVCESDLECIDGICAEPVCVPDCQVDPDCVSPPDAVCLMKQCGPDGCGGTCGTCPFLSSCSMNGTCVDDGGGGALCPCGCDQSEAMATDIDKLDKEPALLEIERILTIQAEREYLVGYITEAMIAHRLRLLDLATQKVGQAPPLPKPSARALALRQLRNKRPAVTNNRLQVRTEMIAYGDYREKIQGKDKHYPAAFRLWMEVTNLTGEPLTLAPPTLASSVPLPVSRWFLEDTTGTPFDGRLKRGETKSILVIGDMGEPVKAGVEFDVNVRFDTLEIPIHVRTLDSAGSIETLLLSANNVEKLGDLFPQ